ncbi:hypothetical protein ACFWNF_32305 [Streptomyces anulatus]|uniref:hypothetical protein n=1 Tax=Streptomyces anulatus TaxID=1892 RepID=UPI0036653DE0
MTTTAPTTAPVLAVPSPSPTPTAPAPAPASRRSVRFLAAAVGCFAVAGLLYVLVDRPGLREPLEAAAQVIGAFFGAAGFIWGVTRPRQ